MKKELSDKYGHKKSGRIIYRSSHAVAHLSPSLNLIQSYE